MKTILAAFLILCLTVQAHAAERADITLNDGTVLKKARIAVIGETHAHIVHEGGLGSFEIDDVPLDVLARAHMELEKRGANTRMNTKEGAIRASATEDEIQRTTEARDSLPSPAITMPAAVLQNAAEEHNTTSRPSPTLSPIYAIFLTLLIACAVGAVLTSLLNRHRRRSEADAERRFVGIVERYRVEFGATDSGNRFLSSIGGTSAIRLQGSTAGTNGLGVAVLSWGLGAGVGLSIVGGLLTGFGSEVSDTLARQSIDCDKTPDQIAAEQEIANVLAAYVGSKKRHDARLAILWISLSLAPVVHACNVDL